MMMRIHSGGFVGGSGASSSGRRRGISSNNLLPEIRRGSVVCYSSLNSYAILGLSPFASKDDVRSAYRRLALKYHPDVVVRGNAAAAAVDQDFFREIKSAYESLMEKFEEEEELRRNNNERYQAADEWDEWDEWMGYEGGVPIPATTYPAF